MSHRYFYQNRIAPGTVIKPLSTAQGFIGSDAPRVTNGSGTIIFSGNYIGSDATLYTVEIDLAGDVGTATFKWRTSATEAGLWEASGVLTSATPVSLNNAVSVRFTTGAGEDFSLGDRSEAAASRFYSGAKLRDWDPATEWRSGTPSDPETVIFDLGSAKEVKAVILHGHNISSGATVKIQGNAADSWGAPALDETIAFRAGTMRRYLTSGTKTYRYRRLKIEGDAGNAAGYIKLPELFLGDYFEPEYDFDLNNTLGAEAEEDLKRTESRGSRLALLARREVAHIPYSLVSAAQRDLFRAMFDAVKDLPNEKTQPLFADLDVDDPGKTFLMDIEGRFLPRQIKPGLYAFNIALRERVA